jgi:hypothetical protein
MSKDITKNMIGKSGELYIASFLLKHEIEIYIPLVDSGIDLLAKYEDMFIHLQVKSFKAYSQVVGVKQDWLKQLNGMYFLVVIYRKKDETNDYLVLSKEQTINRTVPTIKGSWNDVKIDKNEREDFKNQDLHWLIKQIKSQS